MGRELKLQWNEHILSVRHSKEVQRILAPGEMIKGELLRLSKDTGGRVHGFPTFAETRPRSV
jgi:hypothetical protein